MQVAFYGCTEWHSAVPSARNCYLCLFYDWFHPVWLLRTGARLHSQWQHNRPMNATCNILQFVLPCWLFSNHTLIFRESFRRSFWWCFPGLQCFCCGNKLMSLIIDKSSSLLLEKEVVLQYLPPLLRPQVTDQSLALNPNLSSMVNYVCAG